MNKKRIAAVLIFALGFNTLMGNFTQFNKQVQIVNALSGEDLNKFNIATFETLKTSVKNLSDKKAEVTFDNVDLTLVDKVECGNFEYKKFDEQVNLYKDKDVVKDQDVKAAGVWSNGKLIVDNMDNPGIYNGTVTISYKDNTKKVFKISLIKKPSDLLTYKVEYKNNEIHIKDIKLNEKDFVPKSGTVVFNDNEVEEIDFKKYFLQKAYIIKLKSTPYTLNKDEFNKCVLTINYGEDGVYSSVSQIFVEKAPKNGGKSEETLKNNVKEHNVISSSASFKKLTSTTGEVTITGNGLVKDSNSVLTIPGAKAYFDTTSSNADPNKLIYKVTFDKEIVGKDVDWTLNNNGKTLSGKIDLSSGAIGSVNANIKFENNANTTDTFKVTAEFIDPFINSGDKKFVSKEVTSQSQSGTSVVGDSNPVVTTSSVVSADSLQSSSSTATTQQTNVEKSLNELKFSDLDDQKGNTIISTVSKGKYRGKYYVPVWTNYNPMEVKIVKGESNELGSVNLLIDANFIKKDDYKKVTAGKIEFRDKAYTNSQGNWVTAGVIFVTGENSDIKEEPIYKNVIGLVGGKEYEFRVVYTYTDGNKSTLVTSNNYFITVMNDTISGGGSINGDNSSNGSITVPTTPDNTTSNGDSINIQIPEDIKYDTSKTPVISGFTYKDRNGYIIKQDVSDFRNVKVSFENGKIIIDGLVPGKKYEDINITYVDDAGITKNMVIKTPMIKAEPGSSREYLANVYNVSLGRSADEAGYHYHLENLINRKTNLREFLLNMLAEKEFIQLYKSSEEKILALYNAIVAREAEQEGKEFWIEEYKKMLNVYETEEITLRAIADRMVNEPELKTIANNMGVEL